MKSCPSCRKTYSDNTLNFCLDDGMALVTAPQSNVETAQFGRPDTATPTERIVTAPQGGYSQATVVRGPERSRSSALPWILLAVGGFLFVLIGVGGFAAYQFLKRSDPVVTTNDNSNTSQRPITTTDSPKTITKAKYDRISNGMTKPEVDSLLGGPGDEIASMDMGSIGKFSAYRWNGENDSYVTVNFTDDKVAGKTQFGLDDKGDKNDPIKTSSVTLDKFQQITNGMDRSEVEKLLGKGSEISSTKSLGKTYTMYQWKGDGFANVMVNFTDDKVTGKSQFGLGDSKTSNVELSKANYEKIKTGMKLEDVQQVLGGPGDAISNTGSGAFSSSVYKWSGSNYTFIVVGFMNGKVITKSQNGLK